MTRRILITIAATLCVAVALAACGGSSTSTGSSNSDSSGGGSKAPLKVLDITATSGATAIFGTQETLGMQAAAAYYNAHGGILGHKVVIDVQNDNSDPTTATSIATQQLSSNPSQYAMVWAGEEGTASAALIPTIKRYDVYATAVNDGDNACLQASNCPQMFTQAGAIAAGEIADTAAIKKAGYTHIGVISEQSTYDQSELKYMLPDLKKAGIKVTQVTFPPSAVSLTPEMTQLKNAGVQAVFAMSLGPASGYVLTARAQLGWDVPVVFDVAGSTVNIAGLVPKGDQSKVSETAQYCEDTKLSDPAFNSMVKYMPKQAAGNESCSLDTDGWGAIVMLADAAKKAGSLSPAALTKATEGLKISSNEASSPSNCWTSSDHEDSCQGPSYYRIIPLGELKNTRVYPLSSQ
jgi:branched-chain amino acid transport system substrate-binding protein